MNNRNSIQKQPAAQAELSQLIRSDGSRKITMRANSWKDSEGNPGLEFRAGTNWWSIAPATGPDFLLKLYGKQLAIDFFEWFANDSKFQPGSLASVLSCMPVEKGPIELSFIDEVQHIASWMANATQSGGGQ